jgi:hypothetical protein
MKFLALSTGGALLLSSGGRLLTAQPSPSGSGFLLLGSGGFLLLSTGGRIVLGDVVPPPTPTNQGGAGAISYIDPEFRKLQKGWDGRIKQLRDKPATPLQVPEDDEEDELIVMLALLGTPPGG